MSDPDASVLEPRDHRGLYEYGVDRETIERSEINGRGFRDSTLIATLLGEALEKGLELVQGDAESLEISGAKRSLGVLQ